MRRLPAFTLALLASLHVLPALAATELTGQVVGITDGDTLTLLTPDRRQTKVRLAEIDTPESHQPYGSRAREALADLAFQRRIVEGEPAIPEAAHALDHLRSHATEPNRDPAPRGQWQPG